MSWNFQPETARQLASILGDAASPDNQVRQRANKQLEEAKKQSDLNYYLVYLLVEAKDEVPETIRATAGAQLRLNVAYNFKKISPEGLSYIKEGVLKGLGDQSAMVRAMISNTITTIVTSGGIQNWLNVLPSLLSMAEGNNNAALTAQIGAMSALSKICEDSAKDLDNEYNGERPLNHLVPKFLDFATNSPNAKIRSLAIFCLTQFVINPSQSLLAHIDTFLNALFSSASDPDADIRKNVCSAFVNLLEIRPDKLIPHLEGVINYSLHCIKDQDEAVASTGAEFILGLADSNDISTDAIKPHLNKILPVILPAMVYSEDERVVLEMLEEEDEEQEDRPEDIRPTNAKSKETHTVKKNEGDQQQNGNGNGTAEKSGQDDDSDDEDDEDDDDDLGMADWSLRKCCAASFDVLSTKFGGDVLEISLPYLKSSIVSQEWYVREAAILGFGAIAEGCIEVLRPHLPELVPFLIQRLSDDQAPVRQIAAWTLGRYCSWVIETLTPETHQQLFLPCLQGLLKCCLDKNKKVQEAGCSAFATLTEQAGEELVPYLEAILMHFNMCFKKYKNKNLVVLYDAIQTLTDHVSTALCEEKYINLLLPPLMDKWSKLQDDDHNLCPLFECLSSVTATLGESFAQYAPPVFERAVRVLRDTLVQEQNYQVEQTNDEGGGSIDPPDKDFVIVALDLLDGLVQGLGHHASELIANNNSPPLLEMMMMCLQDEVNEVRQSTFALLGDMVIYTYDQVQPYLQQVITETANHVNADDIEARRVCNNATWTIGEIALQAQRSDLEPHAQNVFERLVRILQNVKTSRMVQENAAIAIGRMGKQLSDVIAPHLSYFISRWCELILYVDETDEKDSAFRGMCEIVGANPSGLSNEATLVKFIETVGFYNDPSPELAMLIQKVLQGYKSVVQDWNAVVMSKLPAQLAQSISQRYGV